MSLLKNRMTNEILPSLRLEVANLYMSELLKTQQVNIGSEEDMVDKIAKMLREY